MALPYYFGTQQLLRAPLPVLVAIQRPDQEVAREVRLQEDDDPEAIQWCAVYGQRIINSRIVTDHSTQPLCQKSSGPQTYRVSGGNGYSWVKYHSKVWFSCQATPPLPWPTLNDSQWLEASYNAWGTPPANRQEAR